MAKYAVTDKDGNIVNVIEWDGESEYNPGQDLELVEVPEKAPAEPGGKFKKSSPADKQWERRPRQEEEVT